jgi:predicted metalloprotease
MRWQGRRGSQNVEDIRGQGGGLAGGGKVMGGGLGMLVIVLIVWLLGGDPMSLLSQMSQQGGSGAPSSSIETRQPRSAEEQETAQFVSVVLADTEEVWHDVFQKLGGNYQEPKLILFSRQVRSGCGAASSEMGPFYCPADQNVYIDLSFFDTMKHELGASGDFAHAYVIAHEVGHHVQKLLGTSDKVAQLRGRVSQEEYNKYSVRLELQADFYAGMWARHAQEKFDILEKGDLDEALNAALAIGDDTLQRKAQGRVVPAAFTHGTSEQRARWFKKGYETGDIRQGDTFSAKSL